MKSRRRYLAAAGTAGLIAFFVFGCQQSPLTDQSDTTAPPPNPTAPPPNPTPPQPNLTAPVTLDMSGTLGYVAVASGSTLWMGIPFDNGVSIDQLRYGAGFSCSSLTPPSANGRQGYLFLANSPLDLDPQNPCINVDGTASGGPGNVTTLTAADSRTASVLVVNFSGVDKAGNSFSGHFELVLTSWRTSSGSGRGGGYPHQVAELWPSAPELNADGTAALDASGNPAVQVSKLVLDSFTPAAAQ
jgi:hypothetical protein